MVNSTNVQKNNDYNDYNDFFTCIDEEIMVKIKNYKFLEVEYLDLDLAKAKMNDRNAFKLPREKNIVNIN